jgi:hypothetical protein
MKNKQRNAIFIGIACVGVIVLLCLLLFRRYTAKQENETRMVRRNLQNVKYRMDQGFYVKDEYLQGEGQCTVIYNDSLQQIGYFRNY